MPASGKPVLIGLPYDASSSYLTGAAEAPPLIRGALRSPAWNSATELGSDVEDLRDAGDLPVVSPAEYRAEIERCISALLTGGSNPLALGGDHSVTYPILRAVSRRYTGLTVLHLDAHPDLYDEFQGDRFSHACPFARIMEEGLIKRLVQVGVRTLNGHQQAQAERFGVEIISMREWAEGRRPSVTGDVYLSLDLDGLDPAFAPGVSHREPGGLSVREMLQLIQGIGGNLVAADVVEYNPRQDWAGLTAIVAAKLVKEIAGRMLLS
jgi:arginase